MKTAEEMHTELKCSFSQPSSLHVSLPLKKSFMPNHSMALKQVITRLLHVSSAIQNTSKMAWASWLQRAWLDALLKSLPTWFSRISKSRSQVPPVFFLLILSPLSPVLLVLAHLSFCRYINTFCYLITYEKGNFPYPMLFSYFFTFPLGLASHFLES